MPCAVQAENAVRELAARFVEAVTAPLPTDQPPVRRTDLRRHQVAGYHFAMQREAAMLAHEMGCVDCETEVLTPQGWVRIDQWSGQKIAEFDPETCNARFVEPLEYIVKPADWFYHFKHTRGLDQMLSEEHRVLWYNEREKIRVNTAKEVAEGSGSGTCAARYLAAFNLETDTEMQISDDMLRLQVAVMADGYFPPRKNASTYCVVRLLKDRKIKRLESLLAACGVEFKVRVEDSGFHCYSFSAPLRCKVYCGQFYLCSHRQRTLIAQESSYWDDSSCKAEGSEFFTSEKQSADFIQYCHVSTGRRASLLRSVRKEPHRAGDIDWSVHAVGGGRSTNYIHFAVKNGNVHQVPAEDGKKYCFSVPSGFLVFRRNGSVFTSGNSGKSFTAVAVVENKKCRSVLVLCPVSVRGVWRREFAKWSTKHWHMIVLEKGTVAKKVAHAILEIARCEALNLPYVVVTNYESAREKLFLKFATERKWDAVIYDESHRAKSHNSSISKACEAIGKHARVRLALTGTPMPHSPMDVFGQYRFLDGGIFGTSYTQFRNEYAITGPLGAYHIVGYRNQEKLAERMGLLCHSVKMSDTDIELPPVTHHTLEADLEDPKAYADLEAEMFAHIQDGTITAANALVKMIRLQQWTSGCVVDDEGVERITGYEKRDMLENLLTDLPVDEPVIVFANFIRSLDTIRGVGEKIGRKCGEISGRVKDLTANSEYPDHLNLLAVQIRAGGVGIDLTRACYVVYYDHVWSLGDHEQSLKRFDRPGQTRPCQVYHLQLNGTVDETVVRSLERKKDVVEGVFSYLRERQ